MRRLTMTTAVFAALIAPALIAGADDKDAADGSGNKLVGTWKMVSAKFGGQESDLPATTTTLKHITPGQFLWVSYDPESKKVSRMAGGTYKLKGDSYVETPRYGLSSDFDLIRDKEQAFTCRIEGKRWHHTGELSNGLKIEEVWERVEPE